MPQQIDCPLSSWSEMQVPAQVRSFEKEWLASGRLGHFEGEKLVFSF
jgi:hypothetical protein